MSYWAMSNRVSPTVAFVALSPSPKPLPNNTEAEEAEASKAAALLSSKGTVDGVALAKLDTLAARATLATPASEESDLASEEEERSGGVQPLSRQPATSRHSDASDAAKAGASLRNTPK